MNSIHVEQAIYGAFDGGGYRFVARSPGFREDWLEPAQRLCTGFGERPAGIACPAAVFARALDRQHVAIVQVADQGIDDAGRPGALGFYVMVLQRAAYRAFGGDPFQVAARQTPPWHERGELPMLSWPAEPLPPRTVEQVRRVLQRPDGPNLLGASQVLVDGGRVVFGRTGPDSTLLRDLWCLLPTSTRSELWPASFAFGNDLRFHVLAVPEAEGELYEHYHTEEQAGDYPEGRYELALQTAAESGDQRELDRLFARRSQAETLRLAVYLLLAAVVVLLAAGLVNPPQPPRAIDAKPPAPKQIAPGATLDLPPPDQFPPLAFEEHVLLRWQLRDLARQAGATWPREAILRQIGLGFACGSQAAPLASVVVWSEDWASYSIEPEALLDVLDQRLGTPDPGRDPGPLKDHGPLHRRLRVLLWKHGVASYNDERLNPFELLERIEPLLRKQAD
jgi:hypothetical protein